MIKKRLVGFMIAVFIISLPDVINAQFANEIKLLASDGAAGDSFGITVAISGNTAIIGAKDDDNSNGDGSGSAYIFVRNSATRVWTHQQKLLASDGAAGDWFGRSVSISGDTAIIGASGDDYNGGLDSYGAAYVFVRNPSTGIWTEQQKLLASDGTGVDQFGWSVSISGSTLIAGTIYHNDNGQYSGSAYVFVRDPATGTWTEQQKLPASGSALYLGVSVSISGDMAIAGAYGDFTNGSYSGSASIFVRDSATGVWAEQPTLFASDGAVDDQFGWSVSISGDTAIAGAFYDDDNGADSGSAYVYTSSGATAPDITVTDSVVQASDLLVPFGDITVSTETLQTVTITNNGNADLILGDIATVDPLAAPFAWMNDCVGQTLTPGASCTFEVSFSPTTTGLSTALTYPPTTRMNRR